MPDIPGSNATKEQCEAIGKLTSDLGICLSMSYYGTGSSSYTYLAQWVLTARLGYSSAMLAADVHSSGVDDDVQRILISNFDAKKPVQLGLAGHSIVGDGYGYDKDGQLWYHLNFGWGKGGYWYLPPTEETKAEGAYSEFVDVVYNIFTTEDPKS